MTASEDLLPGRYEQPRLVGRGGMGEIYLAHDRELDRPVAVKLLDRHASESPELRERFRREALTAARLSGEPHVVTIFDVGEHDARPFLVMEYLPGGTLGERARGGPVAPGEALGWLAQAAEALDAAHARGVVHRDVKPGNLIFDGRDALAVVDFGIARVADQTLGMTAPGTVLGTAGYLAPEQAQGLETTAASDRYALAVVAYELLMGGRPFERGSATAEAAAHVHEPVPPASERGVGLPAAVDAVFERALAKDPARRYPTAAAFVGALGEALRGPAGEPTRPRAAAVPARPAPRGGRRTATVLAAVALAAALLLGAGVAAAFLAGDDDPPGTTRERGAARETVTETVEGEATTVVREITTTQDPGPETGPDLSVEEAAALNDEAFAHMQAGRWEAALRRLERAVPALRGSYSDGFRYEAYAEYNLGRTLAELGRCDEALPHLERSEALQGERREITETIRRCRG